MILENIKLYFMLSFIITLLGIPEFGIKTSIFVGFSIGITLGIHNFFYERNMKYERKKSKTNS